MFYTANTEHDLFPELKSMVSKVMGIDQIVNHMINRIGKVEEAYLIDDYAEGKDTGIIDLVIVGEINHHELNDFSRKSERYIKRKIRSLVLSRQDFDSFYTNLKNHPHILIWAAK